MKKALLTLAIVAMTLVASAQRGSDNFFSMYDATDNRDMTAPGIGMPQSNIGSTTNESAPLGTGLLIMTALGAGYAVARKRR